MMMVAGREKQLLICHLVLPIVEKQTELSGVWQVQCDQIATLLFQYLAINSKENLPNWDRSLPNWAQIFAQYAIDSF